MNSQIKKCAVAEAAIKTASELDTYNSLIEELKAELVQANAKAILQKNKVKERTELILRTYRGINDTMKIVEVFTNDLLHYIELEDLNVEDSIKLYSALRYARRLRRTLIDKKTLVNSAYRELTGKSLGHTDGMLYDDNLTRLSKGRSYAPRFISLPDVLEGKHFTRRFKYECSSD